MLCTGLTPLQIAEKRGVIRATVNYTIRQVFRKTGFTRRSEIIEWARENSFGCPEHPGSSATREEKSGAGVLRPMSH